MRQNYGHSGESPAGTNPLVSERRDDMSVMEPMSTKRCPGEPSLSHLPPSKRIVHYKCKHLIGELDENDIGSEVTTRGLVRIFYPTIISSADCVNTTAC